MMLGHAQGLQSRSQAALRNLLDYLQSSRQSLQKRVSARWQAHLAEQTASLPSINSWAMVNNQLNGLEQRLLDAEQKRKSYMTISELKTAIYQMRQTLQQGGKSVLAQLDDVQKKLDNHQPVSDAEINAISQRLAALNSRLIQLTRKN